ncbi:MAG: PTS sugar transporter subunit IIA [Verrucomicrobiota bacterium]
MKLSKLLSRELVIPEMRESRRWQAIMELLDGLVNAGGLAAELRAEVAESLREREEQVSTGIGSGVAIPHAFSDHIQEVAMMFGRSRAGIDFESLDGRPVHFIILFVVPKRDYHMHLHTLAAIAKHFTNADVLRSLAGAETPEQILAILDCKSCRSAASVAPSLFSTP